MDEMITLAELNKLPHIDCDDLNGRIFPLHAYHDDAGDWHLWIPANGKLMPIAGKPVESCYFAKQAASDEDLRFVFLEFIHQRALWPDVGRLAGGIYADVYNLAASLAKVELLFNHSRSAGTDASRMVITEIEYIFLVCRSLFDLLQETMVCIWNRVQLHDESIKKRQLPTSFRKMVLSDNSPLTVDQIVNKFKIPESLACAYNNHSDFFVWLRQYRDYIAHGGKSFDMVFVTEEGFAVSKDEKPFAAMDIWCDTNSLKNNLGSVRSVISHLICKTFAAFEHMIIELQHTIQFPPAVAPGYKIFMCGPHVSRLLTLRSDIRENPWYAKAANQPESDKA
jgi:hypothetical protein